MTARTTRPFSRGFVEGMVVTALLVFTITTVEDWSSPGDAWAGLLGQGLDWIRRNLGSSIAVFAVVLCLYLHSLSRLRLLLATGTSVREIAQAEQLLDLWTNVFFGIGVVWTAIGMRSALVAALGDPALAARDGAFDILTRLVGGYVMRVVKTVLVGPELKRLYVDLSEQHSADVNDRLRSLDAKAQTLVQFMHRRERQLDAAPPLDAR